MSSLATANVFVSFDTWQEAHDAYHRFAPWSTQANQGELEGEQEGDYNIVIDFIGQTRNWFGFVVESSKLENCKWQLECILAWFRVQQGFKSFQAPITMEVEGISWEKK